MPSDQKGQLHNNDMTERDYSDHDNSVLDLGVKQSYGSGILSSCSIPQGALVHCHYSAQETLINQTLH